MASIACAIVACDCFDRASGASSQELFSTSSTWVWWIIGAMWAFGALRIFVRGIE
jgi:hypothetical protein